MESTQPLAKQSPFKMGWLLVRFDLPVLTKKQRKAATDFRKTLLDEGYFMVQFSVYARAGTSHERIEKHTQRLQEITPKAGNVRVLFLTDTQWARGLTIIGPDYDQGARQLELEMPQQIDFW
jgi:CRISPR-associated protein Cas2